MRRGAARRGTARSGEARRGLVRIPQSSKTRHGVARNGEAGCCWAWQGGVAQGKGIAFIRHHPPMGSEANAARAASPGAARRCGEWWGAARYSKARRRKAGVGAAQPLIRMVTNYDDAE